MRNFLQFSFLFSAVLLTTFHLRAQGQDTEEQDPATKFDQQMLNVEIDHKNPNDLKFLLPLEDYLDSIGANTDGPDDWSNLYHSQKNFIQFLEKNEVEVRRRVLHACDNIDTVDSQLHAAIVASLSSLISEVKGDKADLIWGLLEIVISDSDQSRLAEEVFNDVTIEVDLSTQLCATIENPKKTVSVRLKALSYLRKYLKTPKDLKTLLARYLDDPKMNPEIRSAAAVEISRLVLKPSREELDHYRELFFRETSPHVRIGVASLLAKFWNTFDAELEAKLIETFQSTKDSELRTAITNALTGISSQVSGNTIGEKLLAAYQESSDNTLRTDLMALLRSTNAGSHAKLAIKLSESDSDGLLQQTGLNVLEDTNFGKFSDEEFARAVRSTAHALKSTDTGVHIQSVKTMAHLVEDKRFKAPSDGTLISDAKWALSDIDLRPYVAKIIAHSNRLTDTEQKLSDELADFFLKQIADREDFWVSVAILNVLTPQSKTRALNGMKEAILAGIEQLKNPNLEQYKIYPLTNHKKFLETLLVETSDEGIADFFSTELRNYPQFADMTMVDQLLKSDKPELKKVAEDMASDFVATVKSGSADFSKYKNLWSSASYYSDFYRKLRDSLFEAFDKESDYSIRRNIITVAFAGNFNAIYPEKRKTILTNFLPIVLLKDRKNWEAFFGVGTNATSLPSGLDDLVVYNEVIFQLTGLYRVIDTKEGRPLVLAYCRSIEKKGSLPVEIEAPIFSKALLSSDNSVRDLAIEIFASRLASQSVDEVVKALADQNEGALLQNILYRSHQLTHEGALYLRSISDKPHFRRNDLLVALKRWGASAWELLPMFLDSNSTKFSDRERNEALAIILDPQHFEQIFTSLPDSKQKAEFLRATNSTTAFSHQTATLLLRELPGKKGDEEFIAAVLNYFWMHSNNLSESEWNALKAQIHPVMNAHLSLLTDEALMGLINQMLQVGPKNWPANEIEGLKKTRDELAKDFKQN